VSKHYRVWRGSQQESVLEFGIFYLGKLFYLFKMTEETGIATT
jgi:hypothetical protein